MEVHLHSKDAELYKLCRELLTEFGGEWVLHVAKDGFAAQGELNLHIWDYEPGMPLPGNWDLKFSQHLFLVHRNDLSAFRNTVDARTAAILLKPVARPTLGAFLGLAISAHEERIESSSSLRADRDEMLQCLIQANLKLQEYDQDRTNFLARAIHDFRAPLTAVIGYCGLLLSEPLGTLNSDQKEVLLRMQNSAKRLSRMAQAMFQLSLGRQRNQELVLQRGDLRECVEQSLHEVLVLADEKRVQINVDLSPESCPVYLEPNQIQQVLVNLLDNACRFVSRAGTIDVRGYPFFWERRSPGSPVLPFNDRRRRGSTDPNSYRIDIFDSGPMIPREHLDHIFEEYTSYGGGRDRSGGGLGLAICRMIITQHSGHVWAENTSSGPVFSFVLPFCTNQKISEEVKTQSSMSEV